MNISEGDYIIKRHDSGLWDVAVVEYVLLRSFPTFDKARAYAAQKAPDAWVHVTGTDTPDTPAAPDTAQYSAFYGGANVMG